MEDRIQWLGHATFRITTSEEKVIFIDPWIEGNPSCSINLDEIEKADIILVTHDHFDHIGDTIKLAKKTDSKVVSVVETAEKFKKELGEDKVVGMNIGGSVDIKGVKITMTQAEHTSETGTATGFIVGTEKGNTIYHAGDTGIFSSMELFGDLYNIDVALIPTGSHFTMDPLQAAHSLKLLKPKVAIPMHYGTFPLLVQDAKEFEEKAKELAPDTEIKVLKPGEEYFI